MQNSLFDTLNSSQRSGIEKTDGPLLVIAGAGSGKTKLLTARILHLMTNLNVPAHQILAVTFTNKAAGEMRHRVQSVLSASDSLLFPSELSPFGQYNSHNFGQMKSHPFFSQPHIGTFHSICTRLLRQELEHTPYTKPFVIYDDSDQLSLVKKCFTQLNLSDKAFSPKSFQYGINSAKCAALEPAEYAQRATDFYSQNLARIYELYQTELFKNNAIDFGEIITMTYRILRDNPDVLLKYQNMFQYIHVDEYQDTNRAQYLLIHLLAQKHRNICVVGDEDQSIYKWRGADIRNILDFEQDYPDAQVIKLEQNYRSSQNIIHASSHLISNNVSRKMKTLWTENLPGELIQRYQLSDERAESEMVVSQIKAMCQSEGYAYNEIAIFYRTNAQSRVFEDVFRRERIPYKIIGGLRFYDRKEIKDVLAYFRILVNESDSISFKRIINVPQRAIGKTTVEKIEEISIQHGITFEAALRLILSQDLLSAQPRKKISDFLALLDEIRSQMKVKSLSELYHDLLDRIRYLEELKLEGTEEARSRIENLQELDSNLLEFEKNFESKESVSLLPIFLENITLSAEQEAQEQEYGAVSLMTLHMSKGLEFPAVFMVGMEEGLFPSIRGAEDADDLDVEEERRLCYVGMTRAKKRLVMSHVVCRRVYGNILYQDPARFFNEIPENLVQFKDYSRFQMRETAQELSTPQITRNQNSKIGKKVKHRVYGVGVIKGMDGDTPDSKITVEFPGSGIKKFIMKYANLEFML